MSLSDSYLDNLFRKAIRQRDTYSNCPLCNQQFNAFRVPEVMHWQKRRYLKTRWDMDNAILGCQICNHLDVDIEIELIRRGVDTEKILRKSKSFGKPDRYEIQDKLLQILNP